jgi:hypothetical protein
MYKTSTFSFGRFLFASILIVYLPLHFAIGQDVRGSLKGSVSDPADSVVPGATVSLTNVDTNVTTQVTTNAEGLYSFTYLSPGKYSLKVEAPNYKTLIRDNFEIHVQDQLTLDLKLEVGQVSEVVNVTGETPLLQDSTATIGLQVEGRMLTELPLPDGNPFTLARLTPGMVYTGTITNTGPYHGNATADFITNGGMKRNDFTLDNIPNTVNRDGDRVVYIPPADSVQEFKISTLSYDAQQGFTSGSNVNVATKSGTNDFHGTLYYFNRDDALAANFFQNNLRDRPRPARAYHRYGASIGGPVYLPRFGEGGPAVYDGHNRSFFFFTYEGIKDLSPSPQSINVPTLEQRRGDFSGTLGAPLPDITLSSNGCAGSRGTVVRQLNPIDGTPIRVNAIYDPYSAQRMRFCDPVTNSMVTKVVRRAFPGNIIPQNRISQLAKAFMQYYPLPTTNTTEAGVGSFFSPNTSKVKLDSIITRLDHTFSENNRGYWRIAYNTRPQNESIDWTGEVNGITPSGVEVVRTGYGATYDHVYVPTSTATINLRAGFLMHDHIETPFTWGKFDPTTLPFSPNTIGLFGDAKYLPGIGITDYRGIGNGQGEETFRSYTYSFSSNATLLRDNHSLKFGYDVRIARENSINYGNPAGGYTFGKNFTKGPFEDSSDAGLNGQGFASFLLGLPTSASLSQGRGTCEQTLYHGFYFQDDWRVSSRLTLNLGLRYEYQAPPTERYNRNIFGFDTDLNPNPAFEAQARAAYERALSASGVNRNLFPSVDVIRVRGGIIVNDENNRGYWKPDRNNFLPRLGVAYKLNDKTVIRAGTGFNSQPFNIESRDIASLFSGTATYRASANNGETVGLGACSDCGDFYNPFPAGIVPPLGLRYGPLTRLAGDIPVVKKNPMFHTWSLSIQRQIASQMVVEANYVGNRSYDRSSSRNINALPRQYLSTTGERNAQVITDLGRRVDNPFRDINNVYLPSSESISRDTQITRERLLTPFPMYGSITYNDFKGKSSYNSAQLMLVKRMSKGYMYTASYTFAKGIEQLGRLNETDTELEKVIAGNDVTHRFTMMGIYELPFGKGRRWGNNWNKVVDGILGGWQFGGTFWWQSGFPVGFGNVYYDPTVMDLGNLKFNADKRAIRPVDFATNPYYQTDEYLKQGNNIFGVDIRTLPFYKRDASLEKKDSTGRPTGVLDFKAQRDDQRIRLEKNIRTMPSRFPWFRDPPRRNIDLSIMKKLKMGEQFTLEIRAEAINATNSALLRRAELNPTSANFGTISEEQLNRPRDFQMGLKLVF